MNFLQCPMSISIKNIKDTNINIKLFALYDKYEKRHY